MENPPVFDSALRFIPLAFAALLPLLNPLGSALILMGIVGDEPPEVYRQVAWRVALGMLGFIAVVELLGALLLRFFGISLPVLQFGGGLTLAAMGWTMLNARDPSPSDTPAPRPDVDTVMQQVFYPLTFPLTVGPGVIVVVVTLSAHASGHGWQASLLTHAAIFVAAILLAVLVFFSYAYAPRLNRMLPVHAISGVQRLISFILLCIGAQIAWEGCPPCCVRYRRCHRNEYCDAPTQNGARFRCIRWNALKPGRYGRAVNTTTLTTPRHSRLAVWPGTEPGRPAAAGRRGFHHPGSAQCRQRRSPARPVRWTSRRSPCAAHAGAEGHRP